MIFLIPLLWLISLLKFFLIYKIVFSQFLVFCFAGVAVGWGVVFCLENFQIVKFSQPAKIRRPHCSSPLPLHLPSAANPPFPVPAINFPFFLIQPFNSHLRPLIGHDLSLAPSPPPYIKPFSFLSFSFHIPFPFSEAPLPLSSPSQALVW